MPDRPDEHGGEAATRTAESGARPDPQQAGIAEGEAMSRRRLLRQFEDAPGPQGPARDTAPVLATREAVAALAADAAERAAAAGVGFNDIVVLDSAVATGRPQAGSGVGAYRSPYRVDGDVVIVLDQRRFPGGIVEVPCLSAADAAQAIRDGLAQGAGTIAAAGGYGLAAASMARVRRHGMHDGGATRDGAGQRDGGSAASADVELAAIEADARVILAAAPWVVALRRALEAQLATARRATAGGATPYTVADGLRHDVDVITMDELLGLSRMVHNGVALLRDHAARRQDQAAPLRVLVHGAVGALAFGQLGSAVAAIQGAVALGIPVYAWIDEARPGMAGVRTAWELSHAGVGYWLIPDSAVGGVLASSVDLVLIGALGVTRDGSVIDDPGAYAIAALAQRHNIPVYVCAPVSSLFADETPVPSPRYDVVPWDLVTAFVTEAGMLEPPFEAALARVAPRDAATVHNSAL